MNEANPTIKITSNARRVLDSTSISSEDLLKRHTSGDWGDISEEDKQLNNQALNAGGAVISTYRLAGDRVVWIVTPRGEHNSIFVLLPYESIKYKDLF